MEAALCLLWADAFGGRDIAPEDDFFELGGSSLLAANVVGRIRELLGVEVSLRAFFESSTIAALATRIAADFGIEQADAERLRSVRDDSALEDALADLEGMSDAQVAAALTQQGGDQQGE
jgi:acyl carrier protein